MKFAILVAAVFVLTGCSGGGLIPVSSLSTGSDTYASSGTSAKMGFNINDACSILKHNPSWKKSLKAAQKRWKVPPQVMMAMIKQESSFKHNARPIKNGKRLSSAYRIFSGA